MSSSAIRLCSVVLWRSARLSAIRSQVRRPQGPCRSFGLRSIANIATHGAPGDQIPRSQNRIAALSYRRLVDWEPECNPILDPSSPILFTQMRRELFTQARRPICRASPARARSQLAEQVLQLIPRLRAEYRPIYAAR